MTESAQNADFRRFTPSPGNSSIWRAQETAEDRRFSQETVIFAENRRKLQIGIRHLRSVTFSSALWKFATKFASGCECDGSVHLGAFLRTPAPVLDSISGPMGATTFPDPPILAFFDFLDFFVFRFSLLFCAFFLSFPRILGVSAKRKTLAFLGKTLAFYKKARIGGAGFLPSTHWAGVWHPQGLTGRGVPRKAVGAHAEGVGARNPPFSFAPRRTQVWGDFFAVFWAPLVANPPPANL